MRKAPLIGLVSSPSQHKTFSRETMGCVSEISQFVGFLPRPKAVLGAALLPHFPCDTEALSGGLPQHPGTVSEPSVPACAGWAAPLAHTEFSWWGLGHPQHCHRLFPVRVWHLSAWISFPSGIAEFVTQSMVDVIFMFGEEISQSSRITQQWLLVPHRYQRNDIIVYLWELRCVTTDVPQPWETQIWAVPSVLPSLCPRWVCYLWGGRNRAHLSCWFCRWENLLYLLDIPEASFSQVMNYFVTKITKQRNGWYKYLLFDEERNPLPTSYPSPSCSLPMTAWLPHTQPHFR